MKREMPELIKEAQPSSSHTNTGNLAEAVNSVYKRYGTDLSAFFEDAYKDAIQKRQESLPDDKIEAYQP